jgi:tubulin polyglutamylase TTLL5
VHSADGLSSTLPKKSSSVNADRLSSSALTLSPEESRVIKMAKAQFDRRGGFVRIFPAVDSWTKYSQYLDPATGIPISGNNNSYSSYNISGAHNYNLLLYTHLFPEVPINTKAFDKCNLKYSSLDRKRDLSLDSHKGTTLARQDRYERMLSQGHRSALAPKKTPKESRSAELRKQIIDMLRNGKKMTQCETRRTFSHYLGCVLRRISAGPDQEDHMEIVLKFLQKASNYLRTPYTVKVVCHRLCALRRVIT